MTGGDKISCRHLYGHFFEYHPQFKLWLATNSLPAISGTDEAIWRRIRVIEFPVTIPPEERDLKLGERLIAEGPGILNWALAGYDLWQTQHLSPPASVLRATAAYRQNNDTVAQFIEVCCETNHAARTRTKELYEAYVGWCERSGFEPLAKTVFGHELGIKGFENFKGRAGNGWIGLTLVNETAQAKIVVAA
jgi:putative DNA primase/helicase